MGRYIKKQFRPNTFYHLYNRGNRKSDIFLDESDYSVFVILMKKLQKQYSFEIYTYCLMPNHFHILVQTGSEPSDIFKFMHRFMTCYSMYFNRKYKLVGRLFQGIYKGKEIIDLEYLKKLNRYIKTNPVKSGLVQKSEYYKWLETLDW